MQGADGMDLFAAGCADMDFRATPCITDATTDPAAHRVDGLENVPGRLVNRPILCSPKGLLFCRPSESVLGRSDVLQPGPIYREDGQMIVNERGTR